MVSGNPFIVLVGLKHSGKSSLARSISRSHNWEHIDLDEEISAMADKDYPEIEAFRDHSQTVRELYKRFGKERFMDYEFMAAANILKRLHSEPDRGGQGLILSLGGGTMENEPVMLILKQSAFIIFLDTPEKILLPRIMRSGIPAFLDPDDVEGSFHKLFERRVELSKKYAHVTIAIDLQPLEKAAIVLDSIIKEHLNGRQ